MVIGTVFMEVKNLGIKDHEITVFNLRTRCQGPVGTIWLFLMPLDNKIDKLQCTSKKNKWLHISNLPAASFLTWKKYFNNFLSSRIFLSLFPSQIDLVSILFEGVYLKEFGAYLNSWSVTYRKIGDSLAELPKVYMTIQNGFRQGKRFTADLRHRLSLK